MGTKADNNTPAVAIRVICSVSNGRASRVPKCAHDPTSLTSRFFFFCHIGHVYGNTTITGDFNTKVFNIFFGDKICTTFFFTLKETVHGQKYNVIKKAC